MFVITKQTDLEKAKIKILLPRNESNKTNESIWDGYEANIGQTLQHKSIEHLVNTKNTTLL